MDTKNIKVPKEDRAYLYIRENSRGGINIKFGPDKYSVDTDKLMDITFYGLYKVLALVTSFIPQEDIKARKDFYDSYARLFSSILNSILPDIAEIKEKEISYQEQAIKDVENKVSFTDELEKQNQ
jgi:hypothetical protein